ncbi:hypothetical protein X798_01061 [Onchocerca flexuosa]|uniref:Uncharacterized protein n=1 Tax=Onchocerca flexuosa TaxID=387005 RepID=A0A238C499_9BILA|nr:hypothetical protein X798_01061 [Onchocerca flexuosa]
MRMIINYTLDEYVRLEKSRTPNDSSNILNTSTVKGNRNRQQCSKDAHNASEMQSLVENETSKFICFELFLTNFIFFFASSTADISYEIF